MDSQDLAHESSEQMRELGKKAGNKLANKALQKAGNWAKKVIANMIKHLVMGILKAFVATFGPYLLMGLLALVILLSVTESIPFADWFLLGESRTQEQVQSDKAYEQKLKDIANESVKELDYIKASPDWIASLKNQVKPSWGIPASLVRYQIVKADKKIDLPDPKTMYSNLLPSFSYKTITGDKEYLKIETVCEEWVDVPYEEEVTVTERIKLPPQTLLGSLQEDQFMDVTKVDKVIKYRKEKRITQKTTYKTNNLPAHKVLSGVTTPYGNLTISSLKRYYPGGTTTRPKDWMKVRTETKKEGNKTCTITTYRQYEETQVDDRTMPVINVDPEKLDAIMMAKGVSKEDLPIVYEWVSTADPNFSSQDDFLVGEGTLISEGDLGSMVNGWVWPVVGNRTITSKFGYRPQFGRFHYGVDLGGSAAEGKTIVAARDGTVILSDYSDSYGNWVIISHDDGLQTRYAHMQQRFVTTGQKVKAGTPIGTLGNTGRSTGPHLHFEILKPGKVNPLGLTSQMEVKYDPLLFLIPTLRVPAGYANAKALIEKGLTYYKLPKEDWLQPTLIIVGRESSYNPNAKNPSSTAFGYFQLLDSTWRTYSEPHWVKEDPYHQVLAGLKYIQKRYGTAKNALDFWDAHHYY